MTQTSTYVHPGARRPHLLRALGATVAIAVASFYGAVLAQQLARLVAAKIAGASWIELQLGVGQLRETITFWGLQIRLANEWWWGPQVVVRGVPGGTAANLVALAGPLANVVWLVILVLDLRRGRTLLGYLLIAGNILALLAAYAVSQLYR